jgi:hypothetical protein
MGVILKTNSISLGQINPTPRTQIESPLFLKVLKKENALSAFDMVMIFPKYSKVPCLYTKEEGFHTMTPIKVKQIEKTTSPHHSVQCDESFENRHDPLSSYGFLTLVKRTN